MRRTADRGDCPKARTWKEIFTDGPAGGRNARINISAPGRRADAALQLRPILAAVAAMSANFASML